MKYKKSIPIETTELCEKGCGNKAKFQTGSGVLTCEQSVNSCPIIKKKNSDGLKKAYKNGRPISDFAGKQNWAKGKTAYTDDRIKATYNPETLFSIDIKKRDVHKKILIEERGYECESCHLEEWLDKPITLELDHINGNDRDNRKENLRLLCPNCHSQTPTWRKRKETGKKHENTKHSEEKMIEAILVSENMNQTLKRLGLKWRSNSTIDRVMMRNKLSFAKK